MTRYCSLLIVVVGSLMSPVLADPPWPDGGKAPGVFDTGDRLFPVQWGSRGTRWFGIDLVDLTADLRVHFGADKKAGILVTRVEPRSLGEEIGLAVGDVVIAIEDGEVHSVIEFDRRLTWYTSRKVTLTVVRDRKSLTLVEQEDARRRIVITRRRSEREERLRTEIEWLEQRLESLQLQLERLEQNED